VLQKLTGLMSNIQFAASFLKIKQKKSSFKNNYDFFRLKGDAECPQLTDDVSKNWQIKKHHFV